MNRFTFYIRLTDRTIDIALAQKTGKKGVLPLTKFYSWPARDAWQDMDIFLKNEKWIPYPESVRILNQFTEAITYWETGDPKIKRDFKNFKDRFLSAKYPNLNISRVKNLKK